MLLAFFANAPLLTFYGFVPVALGGMGNNRGAVVAGIVLGLFQQAANFLVGGIFASVAVFVAFHRRSAGAPEGSPAHSGVASDGRVHDRASPDRTYLAPRSPPSARRCPSWRC
jgi:hypothetical protein